MSRRIGLSCLHVLLASALCCGGCDQTPATPAAPSVSARAQAPAPGDEAGQGNGYTFSIRYPQLPAEATALMPALRTYAGARKQEFLDARAADESTNGPEYSLDLEFNVARRTAEFVSVLANGSAYTGGAHPAPIIAAFNVHGGDAKLTAITDLFTDPTAGLQALSAESRRQLEARNEARLRETTADKNLASALKDMRDWVERGTGPTAANFGVFLVDGLEAKAIGLTLIFPPYQVASYAEGMQQIEVPAKVFFHLLKPDYRDAFQVDTEAEKLAPGVR